MSKEQVKFVRDSFYDIALKIKQAFGIKEKKTPSLLCHSLAHLNTATWLQRAICNGTIEEYRVK